jgi:raffinose/stachyose/melibiose transport system substrate-binding protein
MIKRKTVLSLVLLAACPLLVSAKSKSKSDSGKIEINLMHFSTSEEVSNKNGGATALRYAIDQYQKKHPDINLVLNVLANNEYKEKIATLSAANDLPDVFMLQGMNTASWSKQGLIADLTDAVAKSPYSKNYDQKKFYTFTANGKRYAIPALAEGTCCVVVYNKAVWAKAGYKTFPATWDEMIKAKDAIQKTGAKYVCSFGNRDKWQIDSCFLSTVGDRFTGSDWTYSMIENRGAKFTDANFLAALKFTQDIFQSGIFNPDFNVVSNNDSNDYYILGQSASAICGNWDVSYIYANADKDVIENTGFAVLPQPSGATASYKTHDTGQGYGLAISSKVASDPKKLAACVDLIEYLTGPVFADYLAKNFALSSVYKVQNVDLSKFDAYTRDFYKFYENPGCEIYDSYINSAVIDVLNTNLQTMLNGTLTPEQVAQTAQAKYDEVYKK